VGRDLQDPRPMSEGIKVADGRTVLDSADLRLGESKPAAEKLLGDAATPVACREFSMPTVGTDDAADVLGGERVAERGSVPEGNWHCWRPGSAVDRLSLTGVALRARVVPGKAVPAPAVPGGVGAHLVFPA
jgi:hypothetical protein